MITRIDNIIICGDPIDDGALNQIIECSKVSYKCAMLADHHKGYKVPIGGVLADHERFSPSAVGVDIACGIKAVRLDINPEIVKGKISSIMDRINSRISFGIGRKNPIETVEHSLFDSELWNLPSFKNLKETARDQLGTVGGGNHWCNVFIDDLNRVWVGCHFGSRGLGHKTATWFQDKMGAKDGMEGTPDVLHEKSDLGEMYLKAIELAGQYAYAGRDWVCQEMARIVGAEIVEEVHLHHNFLWRENHNGEDLWVARKGSTPAFPGQRGLIAASMTEPCVIFEGVESELSKELLFSTIHGAGRVLSRMAAKGKIKKGVVIREPEVKRADMDKLVKEAGVELRGGDVDESPHAYKRLSEVIKHHEGTIKILNMLYPIGVCMAGSKDYDPYKD